MLTSRDEAFGLAVLEAMRAGLPVIAAWVGGMADLVDHEGTGLLIAADPDALAAALRRLAATPEVLRAWGERGRERFVTHYTVETMLEGYVRTRESLRA